MFRKFLFVLSLSFLIVCQGGCDKIEEPYLEEGSTIWNGRKILIYDFTGHKCGNCPRAHRLLFGFKNLFNNAVIPIAIHGTFFAMPDNHPEGRLAYDFRTLIGDILAGRDFSTDGYYGEMNLPIGLVNNLAKESLKPDALWAEEVHKFISTYPEFDIRIYNSYCSLGDNIITEIFVETLIAGSRNIHLNVLIIEDGIVQWQTDYAQSPSYVENYMHDHVLRDGFTGPFGVAVNENNNNLTVGKIIQREYSRQINQEWNKENCSVVAFIYDFDTKEVLQAEILNFPQL